MKEKTQEKEQNDLIETFANSRLTVFLHTTTYTVTTVAIFAGSGYVIDQQLESFPAFFIGGLVLGFPAAMVLIYKKFKKFAQFHVDKSKK